MELLCSTSMLRGCSAQISAVSFLKEAATAVFVTELEKVSLDVILSV